MRLLKFVNGDAPQTSASMRFDGNEMTFPGLKKSWKVVNQQTVTGCYWLLDDNGKPVCQLNDVVILKGEMDQSVQPAPIRDDHVAGVDLRTKVGRLMESSRAEYGSTFKTAAANAAVQMNAEEEREKRQERARRERAAVADQVERGEELVMKKSRKDSAADKKSKH
jgi:hypothetical protein